MNKTKSRIIWAVNPNKNPSEAAALVQEMKIWAEKTRSEITPVAVFSKLNIGFPPKMNLSWENSFEELAQASLKNYLKKFKNVSFTEPQALFVSSMSNRKMASVLSDYAKKAQAVMVFAHTRIKKTKNPIRLGGFAETLISLSEVPVLLMNPTVQFHAKKKAVLFPTDLSDEARQALNTVKPWMTSFHAKLLLFNQVEFPDFYPDDLSEQGSISEIMKEAVITRQESLGQIQKSLKSDGIESEVIVAKTHQYLGAKIIEVARKNKVELIIVTNKAGPLYQAVLGSVTRDLLVQARCPVLVLQHRALQKKKPLSPKLRKTESNRADEDRFPSAAP